MAKNIRLDVFNRHFKSLEDGLQMDFLYPTFVKKGLLNNSRLEQIVKDAKKINPERARAFLDSIKDDLRASCDERLTGFLEALREYGSENGDLVVNKLANELSKDLEGALNNESQQGNTQDIAGKDVSHYRPGKVDTVFRHHRHAK